jgi:hypothetical protein
VWGGEGGVVRHRTQALARDLLALQRGKTKSQNLNPKP